ncbi:DUF3560 domain-containing protein [Aliivibrio fischeri]|uniref:DUF3560 domain-containing protein n=1 Tax=Aliivibrio fischeri TaxID=668 RepID=UPI0012D95C50|nr:DUF3560 domain-containing protein [Aliivibrio fischeri]MUK76545.1 DUF3560 domain-containing protein [Aliivibrio fischeri]
MTHSVAINSTITKDTKATNVSSFELSGSSKNEFLKSFSSGKLRKNAKKKIQQLLDCASTMTLITQSMDMSDCWERNEPKKITQQMFWAWYEKEYQDLTIRLSLSDGVLTSVMFSDCIYHFSNDVVLTFELETIIEPTNKITVSFEQVTAALLEGYISPLNNDEKRPDPTSPVDENKSRKVVSLGDYQERINSKRERLEERAEKAEQQSDAFYKASKERASMIPFGQPILVGHHSEKRARKDAERIYNDMGKSVAASKKAEYLANKAQNIGSNGIASDDPEAIEKLKSKLVNLETAQETMKSVNRMVRAVGMTEEEKIQFMVTTHQLTEAQAKDLFKPDVTGYVGFASYALSNNSATIRTTKKRIEELEALHNQQVLEGTGEVEGIAWTLYEEEGRIKFAFDGKPSEKVRALIKMYGFKWSRHSTAWVRKITPNGIASAERLKEKLLNY